jgi:hypothetical protein
MEYIKRIFTDSSEPLEYETSALQGVHASLRPMLVARKTRLTYVLIFIILNWISNVIMTSKTSMPDNIKFLSISAIIIDAVVIAGLASARKIWYYPSNTINWGSVALIIDSLKLALLLLPYNDILTPSVDISDTSGNISDILERIFGPLESLYLSFKLIFTWYAPYMLIFYLIRNKLYYLSNIKPELLNTWIVTNMIYVPFATLVYGILINIIAIYLDLAELPLGIIAVIYVLFTLSMATIAAMYKKYTTTSNILSVLWFMLFLLAVYEINDDWYASLVSVYISSFINLMKLSIMCQDMISYIYGVVDVPIDIELSSSIRMQNSTYDRL